MRQIKPKELEDGMFVMFYYDSFPLHAIHIINIVKMNKMNPFKDIEARQYYLGKSAWRSSAPMKYTIFRNERYGDDSAGFNWPVIKGGYYEIFLLTENERNTVLADAMFNADSEPPFPPDPPPPRRTKW